MIHVPTFPNPFPFIMANMFSKLQEHVASLEEDFSKFYEKGNKAAGTRVRKSMQEIKNAAQDVRKAVLDARDG